MVRLVLDLDDELYEVLAALGRDHGCSVEEESSLLLSEAGWREQAGVAAVRRAQLLTPDGVVPAIGTDRRGHASRCHTDIRRFDPQRTE